MKTLILYVYHDYNDRVENFINKAIFEDPDFHFLIICNDLNSTQEFPNYVSVLKRHNIGYDFGGWSDGLLQHDRYKQYDHFIFVNSSVIGPFLPSYYKGKWPEVYINGLKHNVKLFGSTINTAGYATLSNPYQNSHVQTYIFAVNRETLDYLISCNIFSLEYKCNSLVEEIEEKEILLSRKIIEKGWNIGCLHSYYANIDFTFTSNTPDDWCFSFMGDVMYPYYLNYHFWSLYELVFVKGNRLRLDKIEYITPSNEMPGHLGLYVAPK
uniref:Glycosyltransferase n=1 Tax=viral metagenome TaxID=1070528 RepID=A0A6C0E148_9ZZZZ